MADFTKEELDLFFGTEEGKQYLQPVLDRHFSKGLETWKTNHIEKIVEERACDDKSRIASLEYENNVLKLKLQISGLLHNVGLNPSFADVIVVSDDYDEAISKMNNLIHDFNQCVQKRVEAVSTNE